MMKESVGSGGPKNYRPHVDEGGLRKIVTSIPDAVIIVGPEDKIWFANPAAESLFGRPLAQLIGLELGLPAVEGNKTDMDVVRPGGITVTAEVRFVDVDWDGAPARIVTLRDVTDRKRAEERAKQLELEREARIEAEAASRAKSDFLATMSHELRTPLNAIIGYSDLLDMGISGRLSVAQRDQIGRIRKSGRHLLGVVNEVLDLAKVEAGRLSVRWESSSAGDVIQLALTLAQAQAQARDIQLRVARGCGDAVQFAGDADRVRQILVNLLTNAVKFTKPGGTVSVECESVAIASPEARLSGRGPWVRITVADTGIGIPSDKLSAVFDPFVQVESGHTRTSDGTGLGLTISRRLARLMGGDLTATSEVGTGSTFSIWLLRADSQRDFAAAPDEQSAPALDARLQGLADVATELLRELPALIDTFVDRLRAESIVPNTDSLRAAQLADHFACYVTDIAYLMKAVDESRGDESRFIAEATQLHEFIGTQHGEGRARLGCTSEVLQREWRILREEVERVIRRTAAAMGPHCGIEALKLCERFLRSGENASLRALGRALGTG